MLVSEFQEEDLDRLIKIKGLKSYTENTITTAEALKQELAKIRKEQVSRDRQEFVVDDNCNAVPIRDKTGKIVAAISLSALQSNMSSDEVEATIPMLLETSKKISYMLGYNSGAI